jgi:protein transport protein SEC24
VKAHYGSFLERTATDLECGTMDADKSILAVIEHQRGDALDERKPAFFQSAVLYTTKEGQRRVRTCNECRPVGGKRIQACSGAVHRWMLG